jgi:methyl-accepting chemotaxis protein
MKWFRDTKVGIKRVIGFAIMIVMMGVIGFSGYKGVRQVQHSLNEIFTVVMPSIDFLIEADRDLQQLLAAERSMIFCRRQFQHVQAVRRRLRNEHETGGHAVREV